MRQPLNWQIGLMGPQRASRYDSQIWNATRRAIENLVFYVSEHLSVHKKPTPISSTLQKVYLENSIFLLSLVSLGLSIILQMDPTFLEISMYRVKDTCMFKDNKSVCTYLKSEYRSRPLEVHTGVSEIEQVMNIAWSRLGYQDPNPEMERTSKLRESLGPVCFSVLRMLFPVACVLDRIEEALYVLHTIRLCAEYGCYTQTL